MSAKRLLLASALAALIAAYFVFDLGRFFSVEFFRSEQQAILAWRAARPFASALAFFAAYVAVAALSLPGAAVMTLLAGALFGFTQGLIIVSFASSIGATLAFLASRFLLRDALRRRFRERLNAIDKGIAKDGAFYLLSLRLVPLFPFFIVNLLMGLTPIRTATFYWVSQIGMLAATAVYVNAGTQLAHVDSLAAIFSPALLGSFALLALLPLCAKSMLALVAARKPYAGWRRPHRFDRNLIVIGGGSAGLVTAYIAAALKASVTLIEKGKLGGDCLNTGCVPSKALIRSAKFVAEMRGSRRFGIGEAQAQLDFGEVMARVQAIITSIEPHDSAERYRSLGVEVIAGTAKIVSPWEVEIADGESGTPERLTTKSIVIATGARPFVPPIPGIEATGYLTSETVWELRELPQRLLVLGGGPIGCELAQAFARLGSQVTLVESATRLLLREDAEVSELVAERFRSEGIALRLDHRPLEFVRDQDEKVLIAEHAGQTQRIAFDVVLVAVGRVANFAGYGLEALGIEVGKTITTNAFLQTNYPNIYAAGDVAGPYQFTHAAAYQAWCAAVNALFSPWRKFRADETPMPWATFVDPEVARVGLNESEAARLGVACEVTRYAIADLDRAITDGVAHGFVKVLTAPGKDRILGVTIVGEHAAEMIAEYVLAMRSGLGLEKILATIHIYPTFGEANRHAAGNWKKAHAPQSLLAWAERFHRWRR